MKVEQLQLNLERLQQQQQQLQRDPRHSIRTSAFASTFPTLPSNSIESAAKLNSNSTGDEQSRRLAADHHKLLKRFLSTQSPIEPPVTAIDDKSSSNSLIIKAVLGHRLTIPCSNLSLSEIANFANAGKVITAAAGSARANGGSQQTTPSTSRRQNQRLRQPSPSSLLGVKESAAARTVANGQGISLIVWHKDDKLNSPVFTADARGASSLREAKQQTNYESLRGRARLEESTRLDSRGLGSTPALVIEEAVPEDAGIYTCTIEFHKAPTQTHQAHVELISK